MVSERKYKQMFNLNAAPVQWFGLALLNLPCGFFTAKNQGQQLDALFDAADTPGCPKHRSLWLLRQAQRLQNGKGN